MNKAGLRARVVAWLGFGRGAVWRVGHRGRDDLFYEERHRGRWRRIEIPGEMLTGRAHHVVYVPGPERWRAYPDWARDRRDEIVARIRSELRAPDYEYAHGGDVPRSASASPSPPGHGALPAATRQQKAALSAAIALLLAIAAGAGWCAVDGMRRGVTVLPIARATLQRPVTRDREPATFALAIAVYGGASAGAGGLAALALRAALRLRGGAAP